MERYILGRFSPSADLRIGEVKIRLHGGDEPLVGWASCILNEVLYLNNIAIVRGEDGSLRLHFPSTRSQSDARHFHFNPITREAQAAFEEAILGRLEKGAA